MALTRTITYVARCDAPAPHREGGGGLPGSTRELEISVPYTALSAPTMYARRALTEAGWRIVARPRGAGYWALCPIHHDYQISE